VTFRRTRGLLTLAALLLAVMPFAVGAPPPATRTAAMVTTAPPTVSPSLAGAGIDISFPQCLRASHVDLPANISFAVVGVNGGVASTSNRCFASEFSSASLLGGSTEQPHAAVYVNTGNPGLAAAWWPSSDLTQAGTPVVNPNGSCDHLAGAACAYVYGYSMAQADYRRVRSTVVQPPTLWWLDVETSNTWQPDLVANAASLSGMVDYFTSQHRKVGLYSTPYQWGKIAGVTAATSDLAGLPSWLAGGSYIGAPADCERSPLTRNGRVAMVQYVLQFDNNFSCHRFGRISASILPAGQSVVGSELTAVSGTWDPSDVSYSYQWSRNGAVIAGATSNTYLPTALDVGGIVTVAITGLESGFSAASKTSNGVAIVVAPTPIPN
jgi:hypothetical protein